MSNMTRQNNKGADRTMESNDSPEIPDMTGDIRRAGLPSGLMNVIQRYINTVISNNSNNIIIITIIIKYFIF